MLRSDWLRNRLLLSVSGASVLLISLSFAVSIGAVPVSIGTVWSIMANKVWPELIEQTWTQGREAIVGNFVFPAPY